MSAEETSTVELVEIYPAGELWYFRWYLGQPEPDSGFPPRLVSIEHQLKSNEAYESLNEARSAVSTAYPDLPVRIVQRPHDEWSCTEHVWRWSVLATSLAAGGLLNRLRRTDHDGAHLTSNGSTKGFSDG